MRYNQIRSLDISNGDGIGMSLFVQGCRFHCKDCFNQETWDFNNGQEWTEEIEKEFLELANRPYIKRISILGGEPLEEENLGSVLELLKKIRILFNNTKSVWLYSGFIFDEAIKNEKRKQIIKLCDIMVDGRFESDKKNLLLKFRGSSNQRLVDIKKSIEKGETYEYKRVY